jgi:uncharacterized protein DUF6541
MSLLLGFPLLGIAWLLPEHGFGLWLRLAGATLVLLLPGRLVALALGLASWSAAFAWSVGIVAGALAVTFAVHASLTLTLVLVLVAAAVGGVATSLQAGCSRFNALPRPRLTAGCALIGLALGIALWGNAGIVKGDALFHLGRIRKLDDFGSLSLRAVDEFKDGGLHPGYAFPLWHGWLALIARLARVDPTAVIVHESSILAPLAVIIAFELGFVLFRSNWLAAGVAAAQLGVIALAPGGGGAYTSLALPGTTARQLLVPAATALFFAMVREPAWQRALTVAVAGMGLAFVHPTYALFVAIPLLGYALVRVRDLRPNAAALASFGVPVLLVFAWLLPIVRETGSHSPDPAEKARALRTYAEDLVVHSPTSYHLAPSLVGRTGAIAVAALVLVPVAALAARSRWSAFVLGGTVLVLVIELWARIFPHFSDLVSLSQSRRAAGFVPFAIALAGGAAVLARGLGVLLLPIALAAGIVLQLEYPGDFGRRLAHGGPALATWIALFGGLAGIAIAWAWRRRVERTDWIAGLAVLLFVAPVAVHGFTHWRRGPETDRYALTPGLVQFLRARVPERSVVYGDLETSYRISAYAPVYVANAPPTHVADTTANDPYGRRDALLRFLRTGNIAIPRRYGAGWIVLRPGERLRGDARLVYRDGRFRVYRL